MFIIWPFTGKGPTPVLDLFNECAYTPFVFVFVFNKNEIINYFVILCIDLLFFRLKTVRFLSVLSLSSASLIFPIF